MAIPGYVVPGVQVFQEFNLIPVGIIRPRSAYVAGPHAQLLRHSESDEKSLIALGDYDMTSDRTYGWPGQAAGSVVDQDYAKLFMDDALLKYFEDGIGDGELITAVDDTPNQIQIDGTEGFVTSPSVARLAALGDRDVKLDDIVHVTDGTVLVKTYVQGIRAEATASSLGTADPDPANQATLVASFAATHTGGTTNSNTLAVAGTGYSALGDGVLDETYTVTVVNSSVGNALQTATLNIISASGLDDQLGIHPAVVGTGFTVGSRGLQLTFTSAGAVGGLSDANLLTGQTWTVTAKQAYTAITGTAGGTYSGPNTTHYEILVSKGGFFADPNPAKRPVLTVNTQDGSDYGTVTVNTVGTAYTIGHHGVTFTFTAGLTKLRKGDRFSIAVTAAGSGRRSILVLGHALPAALASAADLELKLFIQRDIEIPQESLALSGGMNWEGDPDQITIQGGIEVYDDEITVGGSPVSVPVEGGSLFVEYRTWLTDLVGDVGSITDIADIDQLISGPIDPDNPLKYGVFKTLGGANGTPVLFSAVADPDDDEAWVTALDVVNERNDVYGLVPLTKKRSVLELFKAHVTNASSATQNRWRTLWVNLDAVMNEVVADAISSDNGQPILATIMPPPDDSSDENIYLQVTSGNVLLKGLGGKPGDKIRINYDVNTDGYDEYVIADFISEDIAILTGGPDSPISVPMRMELWHPLSKNEQSVAVGSEAGGWGDRRVRAVWPDLVGSGGTMVPGYYLCCALAGLRSGVAPHQGLTNVEVSGFDDLSRSSRYFNTSQLNTMASNGAWIVTSNPQGKIYTRHALTTNTTDLNSSEEMVTSNVDSISYFIYDRLSPFIGIMNVTEDGVSLIETQMGAIISGLRSQVLVARLGPQLLGGTEFTVNKDPLHGDRILIFVSAQLPYPFNYAEVHIGV